MYCVTLHCERRESISVEEQGRRGRVGVVAKVLLRFNTKMLSYCLMGGHYHFDNPDQLGGFACARHRANSMVDHMLHA